jgi:hypothetical protein
MFSYTNRSVPDGYKCGECGATNCKLWRRYQTFLENQALFCCDCAIKNQTKVNGHSYQVDDIDSDGRSTNDGCRSDAIGWLVPAVPTENNDTYWGYMSVPDAGVAWWRALPTRSP